MRRTLRRGVETDGQKFIWNYAADSYGQFRQAKRFVQPEVVIVNSYQLSAPFDFALPLRVYRTRSHRVIYTRRFGWSVSMGFNEDNRPKGLPKRWCASKIVGGLKIIPNSHRIPCLLLNRQSIINFV